MIRFTTIMEECRDLWQKFSPHKRAWDEWDLMYAFHDQATYTFNFMVHERDGKPDGLIPLVYDSSDGSHELFGGCYPDSRVLWINIADFPEYFAQFPDKTVLFDLKGAFVDEVLAAHPQYQPNFVEEDDQFFLLPASFGYDFVNHINTFSKDKRKGFLYDLRKFRERNPELVSSEDDESELFIKLSVKNFGADSDHSSEAGKEEVRRVVRELKRSGYLRTLTIAVDGEKQAVSMSALYGNNWIALYSSSNNDYSNLGKLLNVETIQEGCRLRVGEVNYMTGMTWKKAWNMQSVHCRTMRKPAKPATLPVSPAA
ncbi:MAG: GNAT family N-acetyltransferase [Gammaproteobacteria bacterium]|nr:GNAT family N-acetyltransferase [Gammaproteobacteria bacterium]